MINLNSTSNTLSSAIVGLSTSLTNVESNSSNYTEATSNELMINLNSTSNTLSSAIVGLSTSLTNVESNSSNYTEATSNELMINLNSTSNTLSSAIVGLSTSLTNVESNSSNYTEATSNELMINLNSTSNTLSSAIVNTSNSILSNINYVTNLNYVTSLGTQSGSDLVLGASDKTIRMSGDAVVSGTLTASNLKIVGATTVVNTFTTETSNLILTYSGIGADYALDVRAGTAHFACNVTFDGSSITFKSNSIALASIVGLSTSLTTLSAGIANCVSKSGDSFINGNLVVTNNKTVAAPNVNASNVGASNIGVLGTVTAAGFPINEFFYAGGFGDSSWNSNVLVPKLVLDYMFTTPSSFLQHTANSINVNAPMFNVYGNTEFANSKRVTFKGPTYFSNQNYFTDYTEFSSTNVHFKGSNYFDSGSYTRFDGIAIFNQSAFANVEITGTVNAKSNSYTNFESGANTNFKSGATTTFEPGAITYFQSTPIFNLGATFNSEPPRFNVGALFTEGATFCNVSPIFTAGATFSNTSPAFIAGAIFSNTSYFNGQNNFTDFTEFGCNTNVQFKGSNFFDSSSVTRFDGSAVFYKPTTFHDVNVNGSVTADTFIGDGSQLLNLNLSSIPTATTSNQGLVTLVNDTSSTSTDGYAATPNSVHLANENADSRLKRDSNETTNGTLTITGGNSLIVDGAVGGSGQVVAPTVVAGTTVITPSIDSVGGTIDFNYNRVLNVDSLVVRSNISVTLIGTNTFTNLPTDLVRIDAATGRILDSYISSNIVRLMSDGTINPAMLPVNNDGSRPFSMMRTMDKVGIGIRFAQQKLHVNNGNQCITNGRLSIGTPTPLGALHIYDDNGGVPSLVVENKGSYDTVQIRGSGDFPVLYVTANCNVGIWNQSPQYPLDCGGTVRAQLIRTDSISSDGSGTIDMNSSILSNVNSIQVDNELACSTLQNKQNNTSSYITSVAPLTITGGVVGATSIGLNVAQYIQTKGVLTVSDRRVKTNIQPTDADADLHRVLSIPVNTFDFIAGGGDKYMGHGKEAKSTSGFIAQEIETYIPGAIKTVTNAIPSIMAQGKVAMNSKTIELYEESSMNNVAKNMSIKIIYANKDYVRTVTNIHHNVIELNTIIPIANANANRNVFVYGEVVDDFKMVDTNRLMPMVFNSVKSLHKQLETQSKLLQEVLTRLERLEDASS